MIDSRTLARQRGLRAVENDREAEPCSKCGTMTRAKTGTCRACHHGYGLPDPRTLTTERIVSYDAVLRAELKRRRDELEAAMGEP